jgi:CRISPR-associated protein Cmr2
MTRYTAITFAPVQGFIEKSRKLRDLYGSSFILSFLAKTLCNYITQQQAKVIVPGSIGNTKGVPNNIYLSGEIEPTELKKEFDRAWKTLVDTCRQYIEQEYHRYRQQPTDRSLPWKREWNLWANYTWELFIVCGEESESFDDVRKRMSDRKQARDWVGINWRGESSSLSGADAIAYPNMTTYHPVSSPNADAEIKEFYQFLSEAMPDKSIDPSERLSIPELIKRLITYNAVRTQVNNYRNSDKYQYLASIEELGSFTEIDRQENHRWTGWFQGDGDRIGVYISDLFANKDADRRDAELRKFSKAMLDWGENLQKQTSEILKRPTASSADLHERIKGRIVYAGGDDFFGVLYRNPENGAQLTPSECLEKFWYKFNDELWDRCQQPISVSTGFVWAAPNVPQRDLLQHLRETEKIAKAEGRDRLAIRILFNSGNHLDWSCPWGQLETLLNSYCDRADGKNWTHIYTDIATLEARHAFRDDDSSVARGLFQIYFPKFKLDDEVLWSKKIAPDATYERLYSTLLGNPPIGEIDRPKWFNRWFIALAKVGFHLFR